RLGGRRHPSLGRNEQRVVELMPKTIELGAYRWLAQVQASSRPRDVLFDQQRLQSDQQIEVQALGIHSLDSSRTFLRFQIWLREAQNSWSRVDLTLHASAAGHGRHRSGRKRCAPYDQENQH